MTTWLFKPSFPYLYIFVFLWINEMFEKMITSWRFRNILKISLIYISRKVETVFVYVSEAKAKFKDYVNKLATLVTDPQSGDKFVVLRPEVREQRRSRQPFVPQSNPSGTSFTCVPQPQSLNAVQCVYPGREPPRPPLHGQLPIQPQMPPLHSKGNRRESSIFINQFHSERI